MSCGLLVFGACLLIGATAQGVTPQSPEVRKLVDAALAHLEKPIVDVNGQKLGGKCLVALAFLKANHRDHPRIAEAVKACRDTMANASPIDLDVYSNGLAVIFLCEAAPTTYSREIQWYLNRMRQRQKPHGGWGYENMESGDTSQTQYATLCYWEAHRKGFHLDAASVESVADWLMRTQSPEGVWGYQGRVAEPGQRIKQDLTSNSMLAAGLGSAFICADLLGASKRDSSAATSVPAEEKPTGLPSALRRVGGGNGGEQPVGPPEKFRPQRTNVAKLMTTIEDGKGWIQRNYKIDNGAYQNYYLYALERFKSFQELFDGDFVEEPAWYNDGFSFLSRTQKNGSWSHDCGSACDTAFAVLFLLRSTQQSIRKGLGEGALVSGRGLPTNLRKAKMVDGQFVIEQVHAKVGELLAMIESGDDATLDDLARDPSQLVVEAVNSESGRQLQQLARGGEPEVRFLAVRALGRTGNIDFVPTLIYALTDPDRRIVLEARNSLRFISRRFQGLGPPDDFTEEQRFEAIDAWKNWYRSLRPGAVFER
jgi:hypothetical protein